MKNFKKFLGAILAALTVFSMFSVLAFAAEKKEVKKITLSNYSYTVYYNEAVVHKPNLTASSKVPYKPSSVYVKLLYLKDGKWKEYGTSNLVKEGTYRWGIQVRIDGNNAKKYKFAANPSVYVDSKKWTAGSVTNASTYSTAIIYSPSFKITKSNKRPSKTKIKSVELTVPTYYTGAKIPSNYGNIVLSGKGVKFSGVTMPRTYCAEIQSGALASGTTFKKGKTYLIRFYLEPNDNYEFTSGTKAKINGKSINSKNIKIIKNTKGVPELCIIYSITIKDKPSNNTGGSNNGSNNSSNNGLWNTIKNLFKTALKSFTSLFKFFK